ncbi:hypothetical protein NM688_g4123 [Phlebia brevispora]|uniref:Uncharacterized protein n=1 Tax=Phlebia brevispora TaxID=194682 RepID=A0ACC1T3W8_9APHY|nr:hypothetical protein NM688_g4123 [Phlebia brevispora]
MQQTLISTTASALEVKVAYHRALLQSHPDKQSLVNGSSPSPHPEHVDIGLLKRAYTTLSSEELKKNYDSTRKAISAGPRPAQVVSLEDFTEVDEGAEDILWTYDCRCGGRYRIRESEMERGQHLVGCNGCSEVIWVGYELAETEGSET